MQEKKTMSFCQYLRGLFLFGLWLTGTQATAHSILGEGSKWEIGGPGSGHGTFYQIRDLVFDAHNQMYVLDGIEWKNGQLVGNGLVQRFDLQGKFLGQISIVDRGLKEDNAPARLAVDSRGNVYVTQPRAGLVEHFSPEGKLLHRFAIPAATAITVRRLGGHEQIVVVASEYKSNRWVKTRQAEIIDAETFARSVLPLGRPLTGCGSLAADQTGNLYAQAQLNQIYKFAPDGRLLAVLGGGTMMRTDDGSELHSTVALDFQGRIYSNTYGNPSKITRFNAELTTITQREGQFAWADAWGEEAVLAVDPQNRLWVGTPGNTAGNERYHYRPCLIRLRADFFDPSQPKVSTRSTQLLGLHLNVEDKLPYGILYQPAPVSYDFIVKASNRRVHHLDVDWIVYDVFHQEIAKGRFPLPLRDGKEARHSISFTPPRFGWYSICFRAGQNGRPLLGVARHLGVTPRFPGMPILAAGSSPSGWNDAPRQAFAGLPLERLHTNMSLDQLDQELQQAEKAGLTVLVQFENKKACTADQVRTAVTRFKCRVKYWEIMNEPNFSMSPADYVALLKELYPLIKGIDPQAQVMGPTVCGIQLPWYEKFYQLGGKDFVDILSIHDYEGNEAIDPGHWIWKIGELRKIMGRYGDATKPIWQTERAIGGVRAENFYGGVQAVRILLQRDVLETLGIPAEHNLHYYLNEAGYGTVPTYTWSSAGPHPAALATRTRQAMIQGRCFAGKLDFGPSGNKIFMGLRYEGGNGTTVTLRNYGTRPLPLVLDIQEASEIEVVDAFGNSRRQAVRDGKIELNTTPLPVYLRLARGQRLVPPRLDFGRNLAGRAAFSYSGPTTSDFNLLTNGIFEAPHPSNPNKEPWMGKLPAVPQTLQMQFPYPQTVEHLLVFTMRADNPYCSLLDYDLQYYDGKTWVTLEKVRAPVPPSEMVQTPQCKASGWYLDENFYVHTFQPVTTDRLRLVVLRTTHGFMIDERAVQAAGWSANSPTLMLREIEVYGPSAAAEVTLGADSRRLTELEGKVPIEVTFANRAKQPAAAEARVELPSGWRAVPKSFPLAAAAEGRQTVKVDLVPPSEAQPVGLLPVTVTLHDSAGRRLGFDRMMLELAAPAALTPGLPGKIDAQRQEIPLNIKNLTKKPLQGEVRIEARPEPDGKPVVVKLPFGPLAPEEQKMLAAVISHVDLMKSGYQLRYQTTANRLVLESRQGLSPIRRWQVLGPFPNLTGRAFDVDFGPETGVDLKQQFRLDDGRTIGWRPVLTSASGYLDFCPLFNPNILGCAYALTYVHSPTARKAILSSGSDDGSKIWLNRRLVISAPGPRSAVPGQDKAEVQVRSGWNEVLIKVHQSHGGWGFYCDLLDFDGRAFADLSYAGSHP